LGSLKISVDILYFLLQSILDIQNEEHTIRTKPLRISTQRFKEDLKLPVPMLHGVAKTKMSKGQPVTMLHGVATTKNAKGFGHNLILLKIFPWIYLAWPLL
jgi:hypothetical protein